MESQAITFAATQCTVRAAGGKRRVPTFAMQPAYAGGAMSIDTLPHPVVVVLAEARFRKSTTPILEDHDPTARAGQTSSQRIDSGGVWASGELSGKQGKGLATEAANGFKFSASIGAIPETVDFVKAGQRTTVNGRTFAGPIFVARRAEIFEISILAIGADVNATVSIAAQHRGSSLMSKKTNGTPAEPLVITDDNTATSRTAVADEELRCDSIRAAAKKFEHVDPAALTDQLGEAVTDLATAKRHAIVAGLSSAEFELALLRASRSNTQLNGPHTPRGGGAFNINKGPGHFADRATVIEAALAMRCNSLAPAIETLYPEVALEAAAGAGLYSLFDVCRTMVDDRGINNRDREGVIRAAFSTVGLPAVLENIGNKAAMVAYRAFPSTARMIAKPLVAKDFKEATVVRVVSDALMPSVAPDGQISHGQISDQGWRFKPRTIARIYGLARQDVIDDDTSALDAIPAALGRQAASTLEAEVWQYLMANLAQPDGNPFFDFAANHNSATVSLGISGLTEAYRYMLEQTSPEGAPTDVRPQFLVVPPALAQLARQLVISPQLIASDMANSGNETAPSSNPFAGELQPYVSPWIGSRTTIPANGPTGMPEVTGSDSQWFLFAGAADPAAALGLVFLNGRTSPVIEADPQPADRLGILFRGYFDFGVVLLDPRGAVYSTGGG